MKPRALRPGDSIALVSPASPISEDRLQGAIKLIEESGYRVKLMPHALESDFHLAGTDEARASDLQAAFDDPEVKAVYCTRGGYGCARLIKHLDLDRIAASEKLFLGFSDITTLHAALNRRGLPTVYAAMCLTFNWTRQPFVWQSVLNALTGVVEIPAEAPKGQTVVGGAAEGKVVGGCLCLITDSIGTPDQVEFKDNLLIIEDVDEAPHRVDAMLTHLINAGLAQQVAGFIIGEMSGSDEKVDEGIGGKPWMDIVLERLKPVGKPMVVNFPFGHIKNMVSLPLGIKARLDADAGTITYLESHCG